DLCSNGRGDRLRFALTDAPPAPALVTVTPEQPHPFQMHVDQADSTWWTRHGRRRSGCVRNVATPRPIGCGYRVRLSGVAPAASLLPAIPPSTARICPVMGDAAALLSKTHA